MVNVEGAASIVGMGAVTGYGWGTECLWNGLLSGKSAAQPIDFGEFSRPRCDGA